MAESGLIGLHGMDGNRYYYDDDDDDDDDAVAFTSCTFDVTQAYNHVQTSKSYRQHAFTLAKASFFHTESFHILICSFYFCNYAIPDLHNFCSLKWADPSFFFFNKCSEQ